MLYDEQRAKRDAREIERQKAEAKRRELEAMGINVPALTNNPTKDMQRMEDLLYNHNQRLEAQNNDNPYGPVSQESYQLADGSWARPEYQTVLDPETGLLLDQYTIDDTLNTQGLEKFRGEALRDAGTDSMWAKLAMEKLNEDQLRAKEDLGAMFNANLAGGFDQLAASGGVDSGARERMARGGLRDL